MQPIRDVDLLSGGSLATFLATMVNIFVKSPPARSLLGYVP